MHPARAAEIARESERLKRTAGDLLDRAHAAVRGSRQSVAASRETGQAWRTWRALWRSMRDHSPAHRMITVCSFCRRVRMPGGEWAAVPQGILDALQGWDAPLFLSHGFCPRCVYVHYGLEMGADAGG